MKLWDTNITVYNNGKSYTLSRLNDNKILFLRKEDGEGMQVDEEVFGKMIFEAIDK